MKMKKRDIGSLPLFQPDLASMADMPDFDFTSKSTPDFQFENWLRDSGYHNIAGTDEAGRGPLAGSVVAAAVILPQGAVIGGLNDSKKITAAKRDTLFDQVMANAIAVSICSMCANTIDARDIRKASLEAMRRSLCTLAVEPDAVLVDGRDIPLGLPTHMDAKALVKGDGRSMSIAAAAIIAKVTRDRMMARLGAEHPDYLLEKHMGYGSAHHRAQISALGGIAHVHRFSFRPLKDQV